MSQQKKDNKCYLNNHKLIIYLKDKNHLQDQDNLQLLYLKMIKNLELNLYQNVLQSNTEKKQSLYDFLNKKKQIYLSKMNINIKKQQTNKLADSINDQQQTLKARQLYFENDVQFMHKFIDGIKKQAQQAQNAVEIQLKQQQLLVSKLNNVQTDIEKIDNMISKDTEILQSLIKYKKFIQGLYNEKGNPTWKHYKPKINQQTLLFMTEGGASIPPSTTQQQQIGFVIKYQPTKMIQIFNNSQQANIRQIQKLQDKQNELQLAKTNQKRQQNSLSQIIRQNQQKIAILQRNCAKKIQQCQKLRQKRKGYNNKINVLDNQNLDIDKVRAKIFTIYQQVNPKRSLEVQENCNQAQTKRQMSQIEGDVQKLRQLIRQQKQMHPKLIGEVQSDFRQRVKNQNMKRNQQENRRLQLKKQEEQQKKRKREQNEKFIGRKDMQKVIVNKKIKTEKKVQIAKQDLDQQYLKGEQ